MIGCLMLLLRCPLIIVFFVGSGGAKQRTLEGADRKDRGRRLRWLRKLRVIFSDKKPVSASRIGHGSSSSASPDLPAEPAASPFWPVIHPSILPAETACSDCEPRRKTHGNRPHWPVLKLEEGEGGLTWSFVLCLQAVSNSGWTSGKTTARPPYRYRLLRPGMRCSDFTTASPRPGRLSRPPLLSHSPHLPSPILSFTVFTMSPAEI